MRWGWKLLSLAFIDSWCKAGWLAIFRRLARFVLCGAILYRAVIILGGVVGPV